MSSISRNEYLWAVFQSSLPGADRRRVVSRNGILTDRFRRIVPEPLFGGLLQMRER